MFPFRLLDHVIEIVLTGGPCGGKTTNLTYLQEKLMERGFRVFIVPEVASMVKSGGVGDIGRIAEEDPSKFFEIQKEILSIQISLRKHFLNLASNFPNENCVLLYDRGPMDSLAYLPEEAAEEFMQGLLNEVDYSWAEARSSFDGVIHLVTAADGAEEHFTTENNEARDESPELARYLDKRTKRAWLGHPTLRVIDNSTGMPGKKKRTLRAVSSILGIPVPTEIERKFLLNEVPDFDDMGDVAEIGIEQMYLDAGSEDEEVRIRKRVQNGQITYTKTVKEGQPPKRKEKKERINPPAYQELSHERLEDRGVIRKKRYCFIYDSQYFELDVFEKPEGLVLLEVELTEENEEVDLPPFLDVEREVTTDSEFTNFEIAGRI